MRQDVAELEFEREDEPREMTPTGTRELVLLLVALGGMTAAATWAVLISVFGPSSDSLPSPFGQGAGVL